MYKFGFNVDKKGNFISVAPKWTPTYTDIVSKVDENGFPVLSEAGNEIFYEDTTDFPQPKNTYYFDTEQGYLDALDKLGGSGQRFELSVVNGKIVEKAIATTT